MKNDLQNRLLKLVARVIKFLRTLPRNSEYSVMKHQLVKSYGSTGLNYEESQAASPKADFIIKLRYH